MRPDAEHDRPATRRDLADRPLLFAYGTLGPDEGIEPVPPPWQADAVRGRLYDLGRYPILKDWADPTAGWVEGHVRPTSLHELEDDLDPYEGVDDGLFQRVYVRTQSGADVWVYVWPGPLPEGARGPISRWHGPRLRLPGGASGSTTTPSHPVD